MGNLRCFEVTSDLLASESGSTILYLFTAGTSETKTMSKEYAEMKLKHLKKKENAQDEGH